MLKLSDANSLSGYDDLFDENSQRRVAALSTKYHVVKIDDLQAGHSFSNDPTERNSNAKDSVFLVTGHFSLHVFGYDIEQNFQLDISEFTAYPVAARLTVWPLIGTGSNVKVELVDFSPKTLNAAVQTSQSANSSDGSSSTSSKSRTSGSSTSDTKSFDASVSVGFQGLDPTGSATVSAGVSHTSEKNHSTTGTHEHGATHSHDSGSSTSMSVKDWGIYAANIFDFDGGILWDFMQEYPWNFFDSRTTKIGGNVPEGMMQLDLPAEVLARLGEGKKILPPSHLSLYGARFECKAVWRITLQRSDKIPATLDTVEFYPGVDLTRATHRVGTKVGGDAVIYPDVFADVPSERLVTHQKGTDGKTVDGWVQNNLRLDELALRPLGYPHPGGTTFFSEDLMLTPASLDGERLLSISPFQSVIVSEICPPARIGRKNGFITKDKTLRAVLADPSAPKPTLIALFKVVDRITEFQLALKHWCDCGPPTQGCAVNLVINVNDKVKIPIQLTQPEGKGGEENLSVISLRSLSIASRDFHDYLLLGMNRIEIEVTPTSATKDLPTYHLAALSVEEK